MNEKVKILVIDDEPNIVEVIRLYLEHAHFEPIIVDSGDAVIQTLQHFKPSLVLLDVMLPDMSGFDICRNIRQMSGPLAATPIIMLTAKGEPIDKLKGFHLGADDYIVKPFDPNELIARIQAVLRRTRTQTEQLLAAVTSVKDTKRILQLSNLFVDLEQYKVSVDGIRVELTPKEIELLFYLANNPGRVFTRDDLLMKVWNFDFGGGTRTVDAHVKNLRKKLGNHPDWMIQTLWGIGYSFEVNRNG